MAQLASKTSVRKSFLCITLLVCFVNVSSSLERPLETSRPRRQLLDKLSWSASGQVRNLLGSRDIVLDSVLFPRVWDAIVDAGRNVGKYNVSDICSSGLSIYAKSLEKMEPWAIRMYDATGKENSGLLLGELVQQGNYDECLNLRLYKTLELTLAARSHGAQFCSAYFTTPTWMTAFLQSLDVPYPVRSPRPTVDLCVPQTCSETDIFNIISQYLENSTYKVVLEEISCFRKPDVTENPGALAAIGVLSMLLLLGVIGTCLDIKQRLVMADILSGNVQEIGEMSRRLSRFSPSILWRRLSGQDGEKGAETEGSKPNLLRRLSESLVRRRSSLASMYRLQRQMSEGWKPLSSDNATTLRVFPIGLEGSSHTDQDLQNSTAMVYPESEMKRQVAEDIKLEVSQTVDTVAGNSNVPQRPTDTEVSNSVGNAHRRLSSGSSPGGTAKDNAAEAGAYSNACFTEDDVLPDQSLVQYNDPSLPSYSDVSEGKINLFTRQTSASSSKSAEGEGQSPSRSSDVSKGKADSYQRQSSASSPQSVETDACSRPQTGSRSPSVKFSAESPSAEGKLTRTPSGRDVQDISGLENDDVFDDKTLQVTSDAKTAEHSEEVTCETDANPSGLSLEDNEHSSAMLDNHIGEGTLLYEKETGDSDNSKLSDRLVENQTPVFEESYRTSPRRSSMDSRPPSTGGGNPLTSIPEEGSEDSARASLAKELIVTIDNLSLRELDAVCGNLRLSKQAGKTDWDSKGPESKWTARKNLLLDVLLCFSFLRNLRRLMGEGNADMLFSLNGVRVMSIFWIVLGNTISLMNKTPAVMANNVDTVKIAQSFWVQAIINSTFAADSFFVLSGCLVTYHFLHSKTHKRQKTNLRRVFSIRGLFLFYFHRLMRILPCYYVVLILYTVLLPYMGQGPRWKGTDKGLQQCQQHWWANAFFFSNFYKAGDMCMPWTYYLVNDFQFYLLSPLVLYPLLLKPVLGGFLIVLLVGTQIVSTCLLMKDINGNMLNMDNGYFEEVYVKPYCRVGAFAVGMGLGYFLFSTEHKVYFRKLPLLLGWALSLSTIGTVVYITYQENQPGGVKWTRVQSAVYEALSRPAWAMAVSWIIFTSAVGQGGFIANFLHWNPFIPLCRLTYGVYLLHPLLITVILNSSRFPVYIHFGSLLYMYVANLGCSYCLGFLLIALVECPFTKLDILMRTRLKKKST